MSDRVLESLGGQTCVVTGAGRGIGRAIAVELSRRGLRVALVARSPVELDDVAREIGASEVCFPTDVRQPEQVAETIGRIHGRMGTIRVLVNAAGVYHHGPVVEAGEGDFDRVVETNLRGVFSTSKCVLPEMIRAGAGDIINIASIAGKVGTAGRAIYCASKFGVVGFTQALAEEVREHGVRVTLICPGSTNTRFSPEEHRGKVIERMLQPLDIAHAVRMVLSQQPTSFMSEIVLRPTRKP